MEFAPLLMRARRWGPYGALSATLLLLPAALHAVDCNRNGVVDEQDLARGSSRDCNQNGVPDECDVAPASLGFEARITSGVEFFPLDLVVQDLNGDGRPDLGVAEGSFSLDPPAGGLLLASQAADGSFGPPVALRSGLPVQAVGAGDLDRDGRPDLVLLEGRDHPALVVLRNDGVGSFRPSTVASSLNGPFLSIHLADLDGDENPEIVLDGHTTFHGNGDGTFGPPVFSTELWLAGRSVLFRDLDSDGDLDLALAGHPLGNTYNGVTIFRNDGTGTFTAIHTYWFSNSTQALDGGDLDRDGDMDIVAIVGRYGTSSLAVLQNDGKGAFRETGEFPTFGEGRTIALADLDGDRRLDLTVTFWDQNTIALFPGMGHGDFLLPLDFPISSFGNPIGPFVKQGLSVQRFSDLDGDGRLDVAILDVDTRKAAVLLNRSVPPPVSRDCDRDGVPDECELARADCDADGIPDRCEAAPVLAFEGAWASPPSTTLADLNGDGLHDTVGLFGDAVSVQINRGGFTFGPPRRFPVPRFPSAPAAADLDGDGHADLVIAIQGDDLAVQVAVLFNQGNGTFDEWRGHPAVWQAHFLRAGDLDGNGAPDLAVLGSQQACLLLWNDGQGGFGEPEVLPVQFPRFLSMADMDGDGRRDLVISRANQVSFFRNQGGRAFAPPRDTAADNPGPFAIADLDGDGSQDVAVGGRTTNRITVMVNDRKGMLTPRGSFPAGPGPGSIIWLEAGDMDHDGFPDLVVWGGGQGAVRVLLNQGDGRLRPAASYLDGGGPLRGGTDSLVDADGDGDLDIWTEQSIHLNRGDGTFLAPELAVPGKRFEDLAAGDLDGDGAVDLAGITPQEVSVIRNTGGGKFQHLRTVKAGGYRIRSADLDGNGTIDLIAIAENPGAVKVLINDGKGAFQVLPGITVAGRVISTALLDADGDGDLDLAVSSMDPTGLRLLVNGGKGDLTARDIPAAAHLAGVTAGDVDGDRAADLLLFTEAGVLVLRGRGDATFGEAGTLVVSGIPRAAVIEDLDGDGLQDIAVACVPFSSSGSGAISILRGAGAGRFSAAASYRVTTGSLIAQDLDLDGRPDLVGSIAGGIGVLLNNGNGLFDRSRGIPLADLGSGLVVADVDGDGWPDLVEASGNPDGILIVRNITSRNRPGDCNENGTPDSCEIAAGAARDCNHNGRPDACDLAVGFSRDRNENGVLDECEASPFHRGDVNGDGQMDVTDAVVLLDNLFQERRKLACLEAADANNDSAIDLSDAIFMLAYLFLQGGQPPPPPGPAPLPCGKDPAAREGKGDLGCESYQGCRPSP